MKEQIKFRDLNWVTKTGIIGGWIVIVVYSMAFLQGFFFGA